MKQQGKRLFFLHFLQKLKQEIVIEYIRKTCYNNTKDCSLDLLYDNM